LQESLELCQAFGCPEDYKVNFVRIPREKIAMANSTQKSALVQEIFQTKILLSERLIKQLK
jgi:hypothetical protein